MHVPLSPERIATLTVTIGSLELCFGTKNLTVWRVRGERLSTVYGMLDPDAGQQGAARRLWKRHEVELRAGRTVRTEQGTLVPLVGDDLAGFVHIVGDQAVPNNLLPLVHTAFACLTRTLSWSDEERLGGADLSAPAGVAAPSAGTLAQVKAEEDAAARRMQAAERRKILHVLDDTDWNVSETARQLRWSRGKLWQRMREHGIERASPAPTDPRRPRGTTIPGLDDLLPQL